MPDTFNPEPGIVETPSVPRNGGDGVQVQASLAGRGRSRRSDLRGDDQAGREIHLGAGRRFRVLDVVPFEEDESPFVGLLQVEAA